MKQAPNKSIHVLDDDEQYGNLLKSALAPISKTITVHTSALSFLEQELPSQVILILDLVMPEMDGIEVIRSLSNNATEVELILVSGFDDRVLHSAQQLAEAHGMSVIASLTKPINLKTLREIVNQYSFVTITSTEKNGDVSQLLASELKDAIKNKYISAHYQSQISYASQSVVSYEALARIEHPEMGTIFPDRFIHVAEQHDLISDLTRNMLATVVRDIQENRLFFKDKVVSINIASKDIISLEFPEFLFQLCEQNEVPPSQLCLELTESAVMSELTSSLDVLNRLRMKGFSLSIDDFGTGFSSLSQLYKAPFSELKIDRDFVMRMLEDNEARIIVEICIMLGKKLGMKVVAEGVENDIISNELKNLSCDIAQGFYYSKPKALNNLLNEDKQQ